MLKSFSSYTVLFSVTGERKSEVKEILRERPCASVSRLNTLENIFPGELESLIPSCSLTCKQGLSESMVGRGRRCREGAVQILPGFQVGRYQLLDDKRNIIPHCLGQAKAIHGEHKWVEVCYSLSKCLWNV